MIKRTIFATVIALIVASVIALPALAASYYISEYSNDFNYSGLINPSCYQRKLMEQARTKRATFNSKPLAVTA